MHCDTAPLYLDLSISSLQTLMVSSTTSFTLSSLLPIIIWLSVTTSYLTLSALMPRTGRPPILTPAKQERVAKLIWLAYTDRQIAIMTGLDTRTIGRARSGDKYPRIAQRALEFEEPFRIKMWQEGFQGGIAWMLERRYPAQFAKPEIQLSFQHNSFTQNNLSIHITRAEMKEIEAEAAPVRESVKKMFAGYRPALGNGNGDDMSKEQH